LRDPAYSRKDRYFAEEGITWLRRWALDAGKPPLPRLGLPAWIRELPRSGPARGR
jgi:hypothetical protein